MQKNEFKKSYSAYRKLVSNSRVNLEVFGNAINTNKLFREILLNRNQKNIVSIKIELLKVNKPKLLKILGKI